jgi:hypothetical protein
MDDDAVGRAVVRTRARRPRQGVWCGKKYVLLDNELGQGSLFVEIEQHILFGYKVRRKVIRSG